MNIGTNHFVDRLSLIRYYSKQGFCLGEINEKLERGEIKIGKPKIKDKETLEIIPDEGRYFIKSEEGKE